ncbi:MAG: hypothetical protein ACYTGV_05710 [Planctomycetota bacterium]|jgi:hypothetical protein
MRSVGLACLILVLASCSVSDTGLSGLQGTVVFLEQEGGLYGLVGDDGTAYEPTNLPPEFSVDGMRVRFDARDVEGSALWGRLIEILEIVRSERPPMGAAVVFDGTVHFIDLEGGFFAILGDDGGRYDPLDLPVRFAQEGLRVRVVARIRRDLASAHMWGELIDIESVELLP